MTLLPTCPTPDAVAMDGVEDSPWCGCLSLEPDASWDTMIGSIQMEQLPKSCSGASGSGIGRG